jgi:hypothetical protein
MAQKNRAGENPGAILFVGLRRELLIRDAVI